MKRLTEIYEPGDKIEIRFSDQANQADAAWSSGQVVRLDHPGVWVKTKNGGLWFVTNRRRIKTSPADISRRLLSINREFYRKFAKSFSESRSQPQPGFSRLLEELPDPCDSLLDVGCGDGRLGRYLLDRAVISSYTGVDFSTEMLEIAKVRMEGEFYSRDLSRPNCLEGLEGFSVVTCLSTLQHIPGRLNRLSLLIEMSNRLDPTGRIILANWQFLDSLRQRRKITDWSQVGIDGDDVEPGDYLLTWKRGGEGLRYVSAIDENATADLAGQAGLSIIKNFYSDGREGNLNLYSILEKTSKLGLIGSDPS
jgi:2-polyprenyl-3-methyl-5-hydroxy-6-metoxy-1,4-benzoquinol methylase